MYDRAHTTRAGIIGGSVGAKSATVPVYTASIHYINSSLTCGLRYTLQVTMHGQRKEDISTTLHSAHIQTGHTIIQGCIEGSRPRGRPARIWINDILETTNRPLDELLRLTEDRTAWRQMVHSASNHQN